MQTGLRTFLRVHVSRRFCAALLLTIGSLLLPATAGAITATISAPAGDYNGTFTVSWYVDPGPNVGGHTELRQRVNGGAWGTVAGGDLTTNESYTVTPSASGSYDYIVVYYYMSPPYCPNMQPGAPCMPIQHSGSTALDTTLVQLQPPAAPTVTLSAVGACSTSVTLNWSPGSGYPSGVTRKYDVQESTNGGTTWTNILTGTTATSTSRPLPFNSLTYKYRVWAYFTGSGDTSQKSQATKTVSKSWCAPGKPGTPTLSQPTPTSSNNVSVSWTAPTSGGPVHGYHLQRLDVTTNSGWTQIYTGSSSSYTDPDTTRGHTYAYQSQAYNGANSPWSTASSVYVPYAPPSVPNLDDNVGGAAGYNGVYHIDFSSAGGTVTGFKFQETESANATPLASDWSATVEDIAGNSPQTRSYDQPANMTGAFRYYHYRVKSYNADAESDWATVSVVQNYYPHPGAVDVFEQVGLASASGSYTVRWEPPSGDEEVTHYKLDRLETAGVEYPAIPDVDGQPEYTQTLTGGVSGQTYHHAIEACFQPNEPGAEEACSGYTQTLPVYIPYPVPNTPTNLTGPDHSLDGSFEITWSPSTSGTLDHYELEETVDGGSNVIDVGTATDFSRSGANGHYAFRIRACSPDANGPLTPAQACSAWSAGIEFNAFTTPAEFDYNLNDTTFLPNLGEGEFVAITQGRLGVDDGAANYTVPIELPPAVNNVKPNLALTYNSRGGNGLLGVGWSLSGLSTIRRCSPTVATEGAYAQDSNPRYTTADRLCLDGKKLVTASGSQPATDSAYWASGAEYRTEIDSFSQIKAIGAQQSFEVKTRDGLILTYGDGSDGQNSRIYAPGQASGPVSVWALDKVKDRYNNEYTIHYQYNTADGDYYPAHIDFAPGASVVFSYIDRDADSAGERSDMPWGYDNGHLYKHPKLLNKITTTVDIDGTTVAVREVNIDYDRSPTTHRYRVSDITECGFEDDAPVCAAPLTFDWQAGEVGFEATATPLQSCAGQPITVSDLQIGDIDNDGYDDLFRGGAETSAAIYWGGPTCFAQAGAWATAGSSNWKGAQLIGTPNGKALLVTEDDPNSSTSPKAQFINVIELDRAASTATVHALLSSAVNPTSIVVMDMNNDGLEDFLFGSNAWIQQATTPVDFVPGASIAMLTAQATAQPVEYTGDGLADFFVSYLAGGPIDFNYTDINAYTQSGAGTFSYTTQLPVSDTVPFTTTTNDPFHQRFVAGGSQTYNVLDVNGDGKRDYVYHQKPGEQTNGLWYVKLNTGNGFGPPQPIGVSSGTPKNQYSFPYDWDKDGRQDLIVRDASLTDYCQDGQDCWNVVISTYNGGGYGTQVLGVDPFNGHLFGGLANTPVALPQYQVLRGDFNHDGLIDVSYGSDVWYARQQQPDLLTTVTDGFGKQIALEYSTLVHDVNNGQPLYTPSTTKPVFPQRHANRNMQVVKKLSTSDGQGGWRDRYFNYVGAKQDIQGRGFLGFETITVTDTAKSIVATTTYKQNFPTIGRVAHSEVKDTAGNLISITDNGYDVQADNSRFPYLKSSIQRQYGLTTTSSSEPVSVTKVVNTFDAYGTLTDRITETGTGLSAGDTVTGLKRKVTESNTPDNDTVKWLLGFVTQHQETYTDGAGANARTVTTTFEAWPNTLDVNVRHDVVGTAVEKTTTTTRNANGVVTNVTVAAKDIDNGNAAPRTTTWGGFTDTMYPATETNALGHATGRTYDKRFGAIASITDPNQLVLTRDYDALGRLEKETAPDGTVTAIKSYRCATAPVTCPSEAVTVSATEITNPAATGKLGAPLTLVYYDKLQREVRRATYSLNGAVVKVDTDYNADGRLYRVSEPYTGSSPNDWTVYSNYDALDRPHNIQGADGGSVNYAYSKESEFRKTVETVTVILPDNSTRTQITTRYTNALGQVEQVLDAALTSIDYTYDTQGHLKTTEVNGDPLTTVTVTHDEAGNKTYIEDPDAGKIDFDYNGYGELRRQTWQKNTAYAKSIVYDYDDLGRKVKRTDTPVSGTPVIYTWTWDTATHKGLLHSRDGNGFTETYTYDGQSRLVHQETDITGLGTRIFDYTYDEFSRPKRVTYPDGLTVENEYHALGLPVQTRDLSNGNALWTLGEDSDTRGNLYQQRYGNGVITLTESDPQNGRISRIQTGWPTSGGLTGLTGNIQDLTFAFDTLGNLYQRTTGRTDVNGTPEEYTAESFSYDNLNRLKTSDTNWVGVGTRSRSYSYDVLGNLTYRSDIGTLTYDETNNAGVHAVAAANGKSYHYDAYGNMVQRGTDTVGYDVFNKPTRIGDSYFSYGPDHARFKQVNGDRTTYYINGGLYEEIVDGAVTTTKSYVGGYLVRAKTAAQTRFTYLHKDHLGSVDAMTDQWGNLVDRMSFDPWGLRQYADWADGDPTGGDQEYYPTTKGYTGHEMLDQEQLIHMNGRVYDPVIGRFLSPDLLIQAPYNTQSFNRYSYVWNNPLSYTDPSGYTIRITVTCSASTPAGASCGSGPPPEPPKDCRGGCPTVSERATAAASFEGMYAQYFMQSMAFSSNGGLSGMTGTLVNSALPQVIPTGTISPIGADPIAGMFKTLVNGATMGIIYGDSSSVSELNASPIDEADMEAYATKEPLGVLALGVVAPGKKVNSFAESTAKGFRRLIGREFPTKANRWGQLQPYNPDNGWYLSPTANTGFTYSPFGRFIGGVGQGFSEGYAGVQGATPLGTAGRIGYSIGYWTGTLLSNF